MEKVNEEAKDEAIEVKTLLSKIFYQTSSNFLSILKSTKEIPLLLQSFYNGSLFTKNYIISTLTKIIDDSPFIAQIIMHFKIKEDLTFFDILTETYLQNSSKSNKESIEIRNKIENLLKVLIMNIDCPQSSYDFLYGKLSKHLRKKDDKDLTSTLFLDYINLFSILYGKYINHHPHPKNYMYFSGNGGLKTNISDKDLSQGFAVVMWVYIEYDFQNIKECFNNQEHVCDLVDVTLHNSNSLKLRLVNMSQLKVYLKNKCIIEGKTITPRTWCQITFLVKPKTSLKDSPQILLFIWEKSVEIVKSNTAEVDNSLIKDKIISIRFFEGFIGRCSSILIFREGKVKVDDFKTLGFSKFTYGVYKQKIISKAEKILQQPDMSKLFCFFVPFHYDFFNESFDDTMSNCIGTFLNKEDLQYSSGVVLYNSFIKNVFYIGGMMNLTPIAEIILVYNNGIFLKEENKIIFQKYMELIQIILFQNKNNFINANFTNFFSTLGLFMERYPNYFYTDEIWESLRTIASLLFGTLLGDIPEKNNNSFLEEILLNDKIFSKFPTELQIGLWRNLNSYFSDPSHAKKLIDMSKFCVILRRYDANRYKEYCCKEHRDIFKGESLKSVMEPEMKIKIGDLAKVIQFIINNRVAIEETPKKQAEMFDKDGITLFFLLTMDISPCLQKSILEIYISHFRNKEIKRELRNLEMNIFFEKNCFTVLLYLLSVGLIDIKQKVLELLKIIMTDYYDSYNEYFRDKTKKKEENKKKEEDIKKEEDKKEEIFEFISENILFENFAVECDGNMRLSGGMDFDDKEEEGDSSLVIKNEEKEEEVVRAPLTSKNSKRIKFSFGTCETKKSDAGSSEDLHSRSQIIENSGSSFQVSRKNNRINSKPSLEIEINNEDSDYLLEKVDIKDDDERYSLDSCPCKSTGKQKRFSFDTTTPKRPVIETGCDSEVSEDEEKKKTNSKRKTFLRKSTESYNSFDYSKLIIDTGKINDEALEHQNKFKEKIYLLAKHCIDYIDGKDTDENCGDVKYDKNTHIPDKVHNPNDMLKERLNSIKEDENEMNISRQLIHKDSVISTTQTEQKTSSNFYNVKQNSNSKPTLTLNSPKKIETEGEMNFVSLLPSQKKLEDFLEKKEYKIHVHMICKTLFNWFFGIIEENNSEKNNTPKKIIDRKYYTSNLRVLKLITKLISTSNDVELLIEFLTLLQKKIDEDENFFLVIYTRKDLFHFIIDTLFNCYLIREENYSSSLLTSYDADEEEIEKRKKIISNVYSLSMTILSSFVFFGSKYVDQILSKKEKKPQDHSYTNCRIDYVNQVLIWGEQMRMLIDKDSSFQSSLTMFIRRFMYEMILKCIVLYPDIYLSRLFQKEITFKENFISNFFKFVFFFDSYNSIYDDCQTFSLNKIKFSKEYQVNPEFITKVDFMNEGNEQISDFLIFDKFYKFFNLIWSFNRFYEYSDKKLSMQNDQKEMIFAPRNETFQDIIDNLIFHPSTKASSTSEFKFDIQILFREIENGFNLSKMIAIFLILTIIKTENENIIFWANELQSYLIYLIIVSSAIISQEKESYQKIIPGFTQIISYIIVFLFNQAYSSSTNQILKTTCKSILINVIRLMVLLNLSITVNLNKKKTYFIKKKLDLEHIPIYTLVKTVYVLKSNSEEFSLLHQELTRNVRKENKAGIDSFFEKNIEKIRKAIIENKTVCDSIKEYLFDFSKLMKNYDETKKVVQKIVPFYNFKGLYSNECELNYQILNIKHVPNYISKRFIEKRKKINEFICNQIPVYNNKIQKESKAKEKRSEKKNKKIYQKIKKTVFSWGFAWSDKRIFLTKEGNKKLKFKLKNYLTQEFSRPLISPILDIDYYLPKFLRFNTEGLFDPEFSGENIYRVNLNIDEILKDKETNLKKENDSSDYLLTALQSNFIQKIFSVNNDIWNQYNSLTPNDDNGDNEEITKKITDTPEPATRDSFFLGKGNHFRDSLNLINKEQNIFKVCMVKHTHHLRGKLRINDKGILFTLNEKAEDTSYGKREYDDDRKLCFGSFFPRQIKDQKYFSFTISIDAIKYIFKRRYFYSSNSLEIFTIKQKSYFFKFSSDKERNQFLNQIKDNKNRVVFKEIKIEGREKDNKENIIGYYNQIYDFYSSLAKVIEDWKKRKISTFEFLMLLNIFAGRSYLDITQYPVLPWVVTNYSSNSLNLQKDLRSFKTPMGMMKLNQEGKNRADNYIQNYNLMVSEILEENSINLEDTEAVNNFLDNISLKNNEISKIPYYYGSHYSNPTYVNHFMVRLFPYSQTMIEIQGDKFDDPQRLFINLKNSFKSATTQKTDVRELSPEFFFLPEMFENLNHFNFGSALYEENQEQSYKIEDVILPEWCNNNKNIFITKMREILEHHCDSISLWTDIIFGTKQRGKKARDSKNVFLHSTYEGNVNLDKIDQDQVDIILRYTELGLTPFQILFKEIGQRKELSIDVTKFKEFAQVELGTKVLTSNDVLPVYFSLSEKNTITCIYDDFSQGYFKISQALIDGKFDKCYNTPSPLERKNLPKDKITKYHKFISSEKHIQHTYVTYDNGNCTVIGGFWNGGLYLLTKKEFIDLINTEYNSTQTSITLDRSPITFITIDKNERYGYCGTMSGTLLVFIIEKKEWQLYCALHHHTKPIQYIYVNNTLNIIGTCAYDGLVNLYTTNLSYIRSIYIEKYLFIDYIFISARPLPSVITYSNKNKIFLCYNINGEKIYEDTEIESTGVMTSPVIFTNNQFIDHLIYGDCNGILVIRKLPSLKCINRFSVFENQINPIRFIFLDEENQIFYILSDTMPVKVIFNKEIKNKLADGQLQDIFCIGKIN